MYETKNMIIKPINEKIKFSIMNCGDGDLSFEWCDMYEAPALSFNLMQELINFFDADDIKSEQDIHNGGCETCDYGSKYGYTIRIVNAKKNHPFYRT